MNVFTMMRIVILAALPWRGAHGKILLCFTGGFLVFTGLGLAYLSARGMAMLIASEMIIPAGIGWIGIAAGLVRQNSPTISHLLPAQLRALRQSYLLGWLMICAGAWALILLIQRIAFHSPPLSLAETTVLVWGEIGGIFILLSWGVRYRILWSLIGVLTLLCQGLVRAAQSDATLAAVRDAPFAHPLLTVIVAILGAVVTSRTLLRTGDTPLSWSGLFTTQSPRPAWHGGLWALTLAPVRRKIHLLDAGSKRSILERVVLGLAPVLDLQALLLSGLCYTIICVVIVGCYWVTRPSSSSLHLQSSVLLLIISGAIWCGCLGYAEKLRMTYSRTRRERNILALVPGVPAAPLLAQQLTRRFLGQYALLWLFGLGVQLLITLHRQALPGVEIIYALMAASLLIPAIIVYDGAECPRSQAQALLRILSLCVVALCYWCLQSFVHVLGWKLFAVALAVSGCTFGMILSHTRVTKKRFNA